MTFHSIILFLNIMFSCNTLFTYSSEDIVSNWHYIQCVPWAWWTLASFWMFGVSVVSYNTKAVVFFWQQVSCPTEIGFNLTRCGRSNNIGFFLLCCWWWRAEGRFWFNLIFEIRCSGRQLSVAQSKVTVAPLIFRHSVVATPK